MSKQQFDITKDAVLVRLSVSRFGAKTRNQKLSQELAAKHNADEDAINTVLTLLKPEDRAGVNAARSKARAWWKAMTVPWGDTGQRLCPVVNYDELMKALNGFRDEFNDLVKTKIVDRWDELVKDSKKRLNGLADDYQWPSKSEIAAHYAMRIETEVVASNADIRLRHMNKEAVEQLKAGRTERTEEMLEGTKQDLADRLTDLLEDLVERVTRKDKDGNETTFKNSVITNIREALDILPKLNVLGDVKLAQTMEEIRKRVAAVEPDTMREDKEVKAHVVKESKSILADLKGFKSKGAK